MTVRSLRKLEGQVKKDRLPVNPREAIRQRDDQEQAQLQENRELAAMIKSDIVQTDVLASTFLRASAKVDMDPNTSTMNKNQKIFAKLRELFPFVEGKFPVNKKYKALSFKVEQFLTLLNRKPQLSDSEKKLKEFLSLASTEAKRMAQLAEGDETLV